MKEINLSIESYGDIESVISVNQFFNPNLDGNGNNVGHGYGSGWGQGHPEGVGYGEGNKTQQVNFEL